jgi:hypothetical protein
VPLPSKKCLPTTRSSSSSEWSSNDMFLSVQLRPWSDCSHAQRWLAAAALQAAQLLQSL